MIVDQLLADPETGADTAETDAHLAGPLAGIVVIDLCPRVGGAIEHALASLRPREPGDRLAARLHRYRKMGLT